MEELKRFFDSIKFSLIDEFNDAEITKVIYSKKDKSYNVHILLDNLLDKSIVDNLFNACNNKIRCSFKYIINTSKFTFTSFF